MSTGKIIKFLRYQNGLTQAELAELLNVKKSSIQKYESNDVPNLKMSTIRTLCEKFKVTPNAFIFPEKYKASSLLVMTEYSNDMQDHHDILIHKLNHIGRNKVFEYARDLALIEKYQDHV